MVGALRVVTVERGLDPAATRSLVLRRRRRAARRRDRHRARHRARALPAGRGRPLRLRADRGRAPPRPRRHPDARRGGDHRRQRRSCRRRARRAGRRRALERPIARLRSRSPTRSATRASPSSSTSAPSPAPHGPVGAGALRGRRTSAATATATLMRRSSWSACESQRAASRPAVAGPEPPTGESERSERPGLVRAAPASSQTEVLRGLPADGETLTGPAVIELAETTLLVPPGSERERGRPAPASRSSSSESARDCRSGHPAGARPAGSRRSARRWARC